MEILQIPAGLGEFLRLLKILNEYLYVWSRGKLQCDLKALFIPFRLKSALEMVEV